MLYLQLVEWLICKLAGHQFEDRQGHPSAACLRCRAPWTPVEERADERALVPAVEIQYVG